MVLKRRFFYALTLILALASLAARASAGAMNAVVPVPGYVRLHVLANDDGEVAQALKLEVRDAVLACAQALLRDCGDAEAAWRTVNDNLDALADAARARARECGYEGAVRAETGVYPFPDRQYGGVTVPAGDYRALRVVIGAGAGHNWWCVLYPSLCMPEDYAPGEPVRFYSSVLEWVRRLFGGGQ